MTLISFFDEDPVDNIGDLVFFSPRRCVFVGPNRVMRKRRRRNLTEFVNARSLEVELQFRSVPAGDIDAAVALLRELVVEYPDCIFDVTGGTEMMLAAAGIIAGNYDIPMYQRRGRTGNIEWEYGCHMCPEKAFLTVDEAVQLHSAKVFGSDIFPDWEITPALRRTVEQLWAIANDNAGDWNNTCTALAALASESISEDPLEVVVTSQVGREEWLKVRERVLVALIHEGFILDFEASETGWGGISFRFRDENVMRIVTKAGNLLELYVCIAADFADDWDVGVPVDWDGVVQPYGVPDTRNELDVVLTVGITPVIISCKNGLCDKEDLYELQTVAEHFGGRFAKKILVASYVNYNANARASILQRAEDMDITLIPDVDKLTLEQLSQALREAVRDLLPEENVG